MQGLKRMSEEAMKELYPAPTDEWADPVESDDVEMALIRPMLAQTSIESTPLRLAYNADAASWTPEAFHGAVNTFGAAVVIAQTAGGAIVGGYNPQGVSPGAALVAPPSIESIIIGRITVAAPGFAQSLWPRQASHRPQGRSVRKAMLDLMRGQASVVDLPPH